MDNNLVENAKKKVEEKRLRRIELMKMGFDFSMACLIVNSEECKGYFNCD
jgi:hypothetical protein